MLLYTLAIYVCIGYSKNMNKQPLHPGIALREKLTELGITQSQLSRHMNLSFQTINMICNEKRGISILMALKLQKVLGIEADYWLKKQSDYNLWLVLQDKEVMQDIEYIKRYK